MEKRPSAHGDSELNSLQGYGRATNGSTLNFRWLANLLISFIGALGLTAMGLLWTQLASQNDHLARIDSRLTVVEVSATDRANDLQKLQHQVDQDQAAMVQTAEQQVKDEMAAQSALTEAAQERDKLDKDEAAIHELQYDISVANLWISSHRHADKAIKELR